MLNKVILIGRLVSNLELRKTNDNIPYAYFTLAVNRQTNGDKADFVSCVAWRTTAELMARYLTKGSLISVEGRLEVYTLEKGGNFETRTNVNVQNVHFLDKRGSTTSESKIDLNPTNVEMSKHSNNNSNLNEPAKAEENFSDFEFESIKF